MRYYKLVRDKIPDILRKEGRKPVTKIASDDEFEKKLKEKLTEEVNEFLSKNDATALADILEVVYTLGEVKKIERERLDYLMKKKAREKGVFEKKIILEEV